MATEGPYARRNAAERCRTRCWWSRVGLLCGALTGCAPQPAPTPASSLEAQLAAAESAWAQSLQRADTAALGRVLAPEFAFVPLDPAQPTVRRLETLTLVASHWFIADSVAWRDLHVRGTADSATVTLTLWVRAIINGEPVPASEMRLRDTWVRRGTQWQAVLRQQLDGPAPR